MPRRKRGNPGVRRDHYRKIFVFFFIYFPMPNGHLEWYSYCFYFQLFSFYIIFCCILVSCVILYVYLLCCQVLRARVSVSLVHFSLLCVTFPSIPSATLQPTFSTLPLHKQKLSKYLLNEQKMELLIDFFNNSSS